VEATRIIRREVPESAVLVVTQNEPAVIFPQIEGIGARGFVAKADLARELVPSIERAFALHRQAAFAKGAQVTSDDSSTQDARLEKADAIRLLAAIVDSSDDAIISKNLDGVITSWNKGAERLFGYTAQEAIGRHIMLIVPPDRHAEENIILSCLRRGERVDHFETVRVRKNGSTVDLSLTIS